MQAVYPNFRRMFESLMWCLKSKFDLGEGRTGALMPDKRLGIGVMPIDVFTGRLLRISHAGVCIALDPLLADLAEGTFNQVQPRGRNWREAHLKKTRACGKSGMYLVRREYRSCP